MNTYLKAFTVLLLGIAFISLSGIVRADLLTDLQGYYTFDTVDTNATRATDVKWGINLTAPSSTGVTTGVTGKLGQAVTISNTYLNRSTNNTWVTSANWTVGFWYNYTDASNEKYVLGTGASVFAGALRVNTSTTRTVLQINGSVAGQPTFNGQLQPNAFSYIIVSRDSANLYSVYINNTLVNSSTVADRFASLSQEIYLGRQASTTLSPGNNTFDELGIWNRTLTSTERSVLYNSGAGCAYTAFSTSNTTCFTPAPQLTITAKNNYTSTSLTTFSANISGATVNTTNGTINTDTTLLDKSGNGRNLINSSAQYNSTDQSYIFRPENHTTLNYTVTTIYDGTQETNYSVSLWAYSFGSSGSCCSRGLIGKYASGPGNQMLRTNELQNFLYGWYLENSSGTAILSDSAGSTITANTYHNIVAILRSTPYNATHTNYTRTYYYDGVLALNTSSIAQTITIRFDALGGAFTSWNGSIKDTREFSRILTSSDVTTILANGTISNGLTRWYNFSNTSTVTVSATNYFNSTFSAAWNATVQANLTPYTQFNVTDLQTRSGISAASVLYNGTTYTTNSSGLVYVPVSPSLLNYTASATGYITQSATNTASYGTVNVSLSQSAANFAAYEVITNNSVTPFNFTINGTTVNGTTPFTYSTGSDTGQNGMVIIVGSQPLYLTKIITVTGSTPNTVYLQNSTGSDIATATVTSNVGTFSSPQILQPFTTYRILAKNAASTSYTYASNNAVTYPQNTTYFNWTSGYSGGVVATSAYNIQSLEVQPIYNNSNNVNLAAGSYSVTFSKLGWFNKTTSFTTTAGTNYTYNFTGVYQYILNITAVNNISGSSLTSFNINTYSNNYVYNLANSTTNGSIILPLTNGSYNLFFNTTGYAITNNTVSIANSGVINYSFPVFNTSSALIRVYNLSTMALLNTTTVTVSMNGLTPQFYNFTTTNGTVFTGSINPDTYRVTITGSGIPTTYGVLTISASGFTQANYYIDDSARVKTFSSFDTLGHVVENGTVSFSRSINNSIIVFTQITTDSSGYFQVYLNPLVTYYITGLDPSGAHTNFTGTVTPNQDITYPITWVVSSSASYPVSPLTNVYTNTSANYYNSTKVINITYEVISGLGDLEYFGMYSTYNGVYRIQNTSGSVSGGIVYNNFTGVNLATENVVDVTYFYKRTGYSLYTLRQRYLFTDYAPQNTSVTQLFGSGANLPTGDIGRAMLATFFIIVVMAGVLGVTKNSDAAVIVGLCLVGFFSHSSIAMLPKTFGLITILVGALGLLAAIIARRF